MADVKRVIIDPGHGGSDPGAMYDGRREKDDALRLALAIGSILESQGEGVVYTRTTDVYDTPLEKSVIANRADGDLFVSIHRNAMPVPGTASGAMTLVYRNGRDSLSCAGRRCRQCWWRPDLSIIPRTTGFSTRISRLLRALWQMGLWPLSGSLQRGFRNIIRFR